MYGGNVLKDALDRPAHARIRVHRIDDLHIVALRNVKKRAAYIFEAVAEVLTAVAGHQDHSTRAVQKLEAPLEFSMAFRGVANAFYCLKQRIDHSISGNVDGLVCNPFIEQILS